MKAATVVVVAFVLVGSFFAGDLWAQRGTNPTVISGENVGVEVVGPPDKDGSVTVRYMVKLGGTWHETHPAPRLVGAGLEQSTRR